MSKRIYTLLIIVFGTIFAVSSYFVFQSLSESKKSKDLYDGLLEQVQHEQQNPSQPMQPQEETMLAEYASLYEQNENLVGWICVPDTRINYPVLQTPNSPNYYLRRGFDNEYALAGCPYAQENCDIEKPSDNIIIYGHNMKDGSMFSDLTKLESKEFWETHKTLTFNTLTKRQEYEIIAVFKTVVSDDEAGTFPYYRFVDAAQEREFDSFVARCKEMALYDTQVSAEYGDHLLTLSTCEYSRENGRLVVVAKRIEETPE